MVLGQRWPVGSDADREMQPPLRWTGPMVKQDLCGFKRSSDHLP